MNTQALTPNDPRAETAPTLPLMHATFILAGLGTMLLGPILPLLATRWHLADSQAGLLLLSQFCGATLGGSTTSHRLRGGLLTGLLAAAVGFFAFAAAPGLLLACMALVVAGFGVGRVIATVNITAGARFTENRASRLSRLNVSWSLGALLSPLSAAWLASRFPLPVLLGVFATLFLACAVAMLLQMRAAPEMLRTQDDPATSGLLLPRFAYFALLLVIYGGLETCLNGWLTTFALRYGQGSLVLSQYTMVLFLVGMATGHAAAAVILRRFREQPVLRVALVFAAILGAALALAHSAALIAVFALLLGLCLAPVFPATFSVIMGERPTARQAGIILAASGIGAATIPALMGVISTHSSLQIALTLPVAAALILLALPVKGRPRPQTQP